ncbi:MAG: hypothetical protein ACOCWQ_05030 [Nanoarchaeota archaeon]
MIEFVVLAMTLLLAAFSAYTFYGAAVSADNLPPRPQERKRGH